MSSTTRRSLTASACARRSGTGALHFVYVYALQLCPAGRVKVCEMACSRPRRFTTTGTSTWTWPTWSAASQRPLRRARASRWAVRVDYASGLHAQQVKEGNTPVEAITTLFTTHAACRHRWRVLHGRRHRAARQDSRGGGQVCHVLSPTRIRTKPIVNSGAARWGAGQDPSPTPNLHPGSRARTCLWTNATPQGSSGRPAAAPMSTAASWAALTSSTPRWAKPLAVQRVRCRRGHQHRGGLEMCIC